MDEEFLSRARQSLFNKAEVSEALAKQAMEEARALSKGKAIPKPANGSGDVSTQATTENRADAAGSDTGKRSSKRSGGDKK